MYQGVWGQNNNNTIRHKLGLYNPHTQISSSKSSELNSNHRCNQNRSINGALIDKTVRVIISNPNHILLSLQLESTVTRSVH